MFSMKRFLALLLVVLVTFSFTSIASMEDYNELDYGLGLDGDKAELEEVTGELVDAVAEEYEYELGDEDDAPKADDTYTAVETQVTESPVLRALTYAKTASEGTALYDGINTEAPYALLGKNACVLLIDDGKDGRFGVAFNTAYGIVNAFIDAADLIPMGENDLAGFYEEISEYELVTLYGDDIDLPLATLTLAEVPAPAGKEPSDDEAAESSDEKDDSLDLLEAGILTADEEIAEETLEEYASGDAPSVIAVDAPESVNAKELVIINVTTASNVTHLALVNEDDWMVTTWAADLFSSVSGSNRNWTVKYAFQTAGQRKLGIKASADGSNYGTTSWFNLNVVAVEDPTAQALYSVEIQGGSSTATKEAIFLAKTSTDAKYLCFYAEGGNQVKIWNASECAKEENGKLSWKVKYTIYNAGTRTLTFRASADQQTWGNGKSITFIVNPQVIKAVATEPVMVNEPASIKVETNKYATHLAMTSENGSVVKTWTAAGNSSIVGDNRVWQVEYTFANTGNRCLGMKASSDNRNWSEVTYFNLRVTDGTPVDPSVPAILSLKTPSSVNAKELVAINVTTTQSVTHLALVTDSNYLVTTWAADLFSTVSGDNRNWTVQYAFQDAGQRKLGIKASANGSDYGDPSWFNMRVVAVEDPSSQALYKVEIQGGSSTATKDAIFLAKTSTDAKYLCFYAEGGNQVTIWNASDCAKEENGQLSWKVRQTIYNAGTRTLTFKASADKETWGNSKSITFIVNPQVIKVVAPETVAVKQPVSIKVETNKYATHLAMTSENGGVVKTWTAAGNSTIVGDNRVWQVEYTFANPGDRTLGMKASSDNRNWSEVTPFSLVITDGSVDTLVTDATAKLATVTTGSDDLFIVNTTSDAQKLALYDGNGEILDVWDDSFAESSDGGFVWTVKHAINDEGTNTLTFKASQDGNVFDSGMAVSVDAVDGEFVYWINDELDGATVVSYMYDNAEVTVPETYADLPITMIGESAFEGKDALTSINLPDTIEVIGARAFANCTNLSSMN